MTFTGKGTNIPGCGIQDRRRSRASHWLVAKLQFAATWIRFDISFAVLQLARFSASAGFAQWAALHHLMEYLAAHPSVKIKYRRGMKLIDPLSGYADTDWSNSLSRRLTSGMVMLYNKSPIMWKSKIMWSAMAEDYGALDSSGRVLLSISGWL